MLAANNVKILEPTVLYLDEKPPKVVKSQKSTTAATKTKKSTKSPAKKKEIKKPITKAKKKSKKVAKVVREYFIKTEEPDDKEENKNDPLYTPKVEVKLELDVEKLEPEIEMQTDDIEENYEPDEQEEKIADDDEKDSDFDGEISENDNYDDDDDDDEDEPLILLTRSKSGKGNKLPKPGKCGTSCKQGCIEKFTEEQRNLLCDTYWRLNKDNRLTFLREHMRSQTLLKYTFSGSKNKRGIKYTYYLKDSLKNETEDNNDANKDAQLIKVCQKYFKSTLSVGEYCIKKAITGYKLEEDQELLLLAETIKANKEKEKALAQQIKQVLDPVTGNLIIIDPKDKTKKSTEVKPRKRIKRRKPGDPLPERFPKPINCQIKCIYKCHTKFTEEERKQICDSFWSLDFKQRKDYVLANVEVKEVQRLTTDEFRTTNRAPRSRQIRYYLRINMHSEKIRVCEPFMNKTLSITRDFILNALEFADQTTGCYKGVDRRGHNTPSRKHPEERIKVVLDHITSYPKWVPHKKSKTKYLHHSLNIKKMFEEYKTNCEKEGTKSVANIYYYKYFHEHFRLKFLNNPDPNRRGGCVSKNPTISHYTGEEPGGMWLDANDEKLNLRLFNPGQSMNVDQTTWRHYQQQQSINSINSNSSQDSLTNIANTSRSLQLNPLNYTTAAEAQHLAGLIDPSLAAIAYNTSSRFRKV